MKGLPERVGKKGLDIPDKPGPLSKRALKTLLEERMKRNIQTTSIWGLVECQTSQSSEDPGDDTEQSLVPVRYYTALTDEDREREYLSYDTLGALRRWLSVEEPSYLELHHPQASFLFNIARDLYEKRLVKTRVHGGQIIACEVTFGEQNFSDPSALAFPLALLMLEKNQTAHQDAGPVIKSMLEEDIATSDSKEKIFDYLRALSCQIAPESYTIIIIIKFANRHGVGKKALKRMQDVIAQRVVRPVAGQILASSPSANKAVALFEDDDNNLSLFTEHHTVETISARGRAEFHSSWCRHFYVPVGPKLDEEFYSLKCLDDWDLECEIDRHFCFTLSENVGFYLPPGMEKYKIRRAFWRWSAPL